ncbi:uncharacterized protein (TIGR01777 family) [Ereboglobus sp. PH5-10]|uniref:TIGR01777 family oxidoreductase n=1 Tax=Ereboglobus sp. PH5-10 TaxID=2940629 RepID=UPI00240730EC|nr:TIGR01777 family oxidoreductase [Ereboglobus sp. PH5-10]MDF9827997.1 uncharacterized protein (TIGR01777 family) [Ereboglobus sp. PH5-10]
MTTHTLTTRIERPAEEVTAWLARPGAETRLTPHWAAANTPLKIFSTAIKSLDTSSCTVTEELRPPESLELAPATIEHYLACRHATLRNDIEQTAAYGAVRRLRIAVAGASGVIGRALAPFLQAQNHEVIPLARDPKTGGFNPDQLAQALTGIDAVINLAGASLAAAKWDQTQRDLIWESRAGATRALVAALATLKQRPFALLNASATGYYGSQGDKLLDENAPRGDGFLADVCHGWEYEANAAAEFGMRVACLRFGTVLTPDGDAFATRLPYFEKKLGAMLGHGRQWISWISIDDAIAAIYHSILTHACAGPVNITAPNPVPNAELVDTLAAALGKKRRSRTPRWLLRLRHGIDFANETMLASTRAIPAKLRDSGYDFRHPDLETALKHLL